MGLGVMVSQGEMEGICLVIRLLSGRKPSGLEEGEAGSIPAFRADLVRECCITWEYFPH